MSRFIHITSIVESVLNAALDTVRSEWQRESIELILAGDATTLTHSVSHTPVINGYGRIRLPIPAHVGGDSRLTRLVASRVGNRVEETGVRTVTTSFVSLSVRFRSIIHQFSTYSLLRSLFRSFHIQCFTNGRVKSVIYIYIYICVCVCVCVCVRACCRHTSLCVRVQISAYFYVHPSKHPHTTLLTHSFVLYLDS